MSVAKTVDDIAPVGARSRTVPDAPVSAALSPGHLAPMAKPAESAQSAASYLAAGTVIDGKYSIVRLLGQGGMGVVYLARDIHTSLEVVLKSVRSELAHRTDVRARTLSEGRVLGRIDHPNVVQLKAVVVEEKALWLVMQYIDGESLDRTIERYVDRKEHMPLTEALGLFRQITSGIAAAHAEGVIHRDLKPANVLIRAKDHVAKVTDFGIAKVEHDEGPRRVQTRGVIGSIWYMSPEQVTGRRDLDKRVDIYALGILLFQMLTGHVPFDAESDYEVMRAHAETPLPHARDKRSDLPPEIDTLLQKLCAKSREDRLQTCEDVLAQITEIEDHLARPPAAVAATPAPASTPPPQENERSADATKDAERRAVSSEPPGAPRAATENAAAGDKRAGGASVAPGHDGEPPAAVPTPPGVGRGRVIAVSALALIGGTAALIATGVVPPPERWLSGGIPTKVPTMASSSAPSTSSAQTTSAAPSTSTSAVPVSPFDSLVGTWVGNGERALVAVKVADTIELRIKDPAQFAPADYSRGEVRVVLSRIRGEQTVFAVEDRLRPNPPVGFPFDPARARGTCQEIRTEASGAPLRARLDGARLSIELVKIEPGKRNFVFEQGRTISCVGLGRLAASKVISVLEKR